jgi:hypothetical protein
MHTTQLLVAWAPGSAPAASEEEHLHAVEPRPSQLLLVLPYLLAGCGWLLPLPLPPAAAPPTLSSVFFALRFSFFLADLLLAPPDPAADASAAQQTRREGSTGMTGWQEAVAGSGSDRLPSVCQAPQVARVRASLTFWVQAWALWHVPPCLQPCRGEKVSLGSVLLLLRCCCCWCCSGCRAAAQPRRHRKRTITPTDWYTGCSSCGV